MAGDLKVFVDSDLAHFFEVGAKLKVMFRDYPWIKKSYIDIMYKSLLSYSTPSRGRSPSCSLLGNLLGQRYCEERFIFN